MGHPGGSGWFGSSISNTKARSEGGGLANVEVESGFLHCSAHDGDVSSFGRNDVVGSGNGKAEAQAEGKTEAEAEASKADGNLF
jgi:hypothetical protein